MTASVLVMEQALALRAGVGAHVAIIPRRRAWSPRGRVWAPLEPDAVVDALDRLGTPGILMVRPPAADPGAAILAPIGGALGYPLVQLPEPDDEAAWSAAAAARLVDGSGVALRRALDVLSCGPVAVPRGWARRQDRDARPPSVRPEALARWASCAWRACGWCERGGLPGRRCRTCGALIPCEGAA